MLEIVTEFSPDCRGHLADRISKLFGNLKPKNTGVNILPRWQYNAMASSSVSARDTMMADMIQ